MGLTIVKTSEEEYESLPYYEDHTMYLLDNGRIFVEGIEYGNYKEDEEENPDEEEKDLTVGSEIQPVYIDKDGNPQPLEYTIETSVPKDAKFSYEVVNENEDGLMSSADKVKFDEMVTDMVEVKKSVSDGKKMVADAITEKGVDTAADDTFAVMSDNIRKIKGGDESSEGDSSIIATNEYFKYVIEQIQKDKGISDDDVTEHLKNNIYNHFCDLIKKTSNLNGMEASELPDALRISTGIRALTYDNKIYLMHHHDTYDADKTTHGIWDGTSWFKISDKVFEAYGYSYVVFNNEIHLLGSKRPEHSAGRFHEKYNGSSWESLESLPYCFCGGSAVVYNNEIHVLGGTPDYQWYVDGWPLIHYKWNGSWSLTIELPYPFYGSGDALVYNGRIHILGSGFSGNEYYQVDCTRKHYSWDSSSIEWTEESVLPCIGCDKALVYNNEIHLFRLDKHYKFNNVNKTWTELPILPKIMDTITVYNNEIHAFSLYSQSVQHWNINKRNVATIYKVNEEIDVF